MLKKIIALIEVQSDGKPAAAEIGRTYRQRKPKSSNPAPAKSCTAQEAGRPCHLKAGENAALVFKVLEQLLAIEPDDVFDP